MSLSNLGVFVSAKRLALADEAGDSNAAAGNPVAARWLGSVRKVQPLPACAQEMDCTPVVAGNKTQGQHSVIVWLTRSVMLMYIASEWLHSSLLVQSLPICHTVQTFYHFRSL